MQIKTILPQPDKNPRKPSFRAPPNSCDCHFHIFGPQKRFPLHPENAVVAEDATYEQFVHMQDTTGFTRGVLVQSGLHALSYEHLVHFLSRDPKRLRGVAILDDAVTDGELWVLNHVGVRGTRFYPGVVDPLPKLQARVAELGWHSHFLARGPLLESWKDAILATPGKFVVEHAGWQNPAEGLEGPNFKSLLQMLDTGRCWIKLSPRFSNEPTFPFADTLPFIHALIAHAPERMLWGSDWPHPNYFNPMPNDGDLVDLIPQWAPDENNRTLMLVDNPARLFGF